jgi:hypothetical protein
MYDFESVCPNCGSLVTEPSPLISILRPQRDLLKKARLAEKMASTYLRPLSFHLPIKPPIVKGKI